MFLGHRPEDRRVREQRLDVFCEFLLRLHICEQLRQQMCSELRQCHLVNISVHEVNGALLTFLQFLHSTLL
jgi:hypothetical protein